MQLKISLATACILATNTLIAQDYVRVNYMQYNENNDRVTIKAPSIEINKDLGVNWTINSSFVYDIVSGASPVYSDTSSGASAYNRDNQIDSKNIKKRNTNFSDKRKFFTTSLLFRLPSRDEITTTFNYSKELDYESKTFGLGYLLWENEYKNRSYSINASYQTNDISIRSCQSNVNCPKNDDIDKIAKYDDDDDDDDDDGSSGASARINKKSDVINGEFGITQIIDASSLANISIFYGKENGYLTNPYYSVVRNNNGIKADLTQELRPTKRNLYGFAIAYNRAFTNNIVSKIRYKYYKDSWHIQSNTIDFFNYYELTKFIFGFGIRYYKQSKAFFYSNDIRYFTNQTYASQDDRLSDFNSQTYKFSIDYKFNKNIEYNIGYNIYHQTTGLKAMFGSIGLKYNF